MSEQARHAVNQWLADQGKRDSDQITGEDLTELQTLLAPHKGFGILWSLIAYDRQLHLQVLINSDLGTDNGRLQAANAQGAIKTIDAIHELIVSIADPVGEGAAPQPTPRTEEF